MPFLDYDLSSIDPKKFGFECQQAAWEKCAIDGSRNAIAISYKMHHSDHPHQGFLLFVCGRKISVGFSHQLKETSDSPSITYFEGRWIVDSEVPEHIVEEINNAIVEALQCLCNHALAVKDGRLHEIRVVAVRPAPPLTIEQVISRINTLVQICYTVEVARGHEVSAFAPNAEFQAGVLDRLRGVILGSPLSRGLLLGHLAENGLVGLSPEARLAVEWWRQSEH